MSDSTEAVTAILSDAVGRILIMVAVLLLGVVLTAVAQRRYGQLGAAGGTLLTGLALIGTVTVMIR